MDSAALAERISRDWRHIRAVLTRAFGDEWAEEIDDAEGAFTLVDGGLLAQFDGVYYSTNGTARCSSPGTRTAGRSATRTARTGSSWRNTPFPGPPRRT